MEKYLRQLRGDIEASIAQAPPPSECGWLPRFPDEDDAFDSTKLVRLCDLFGIPAEAFPPENRLSDRQIPRLLLAIARLWRAWGVGWEMPHELPERKKYAAFVREMGGDPVRWDFETGGEVKICDYEQGKTCPFGSDGRCYCKYIDDMAKESVAAWEESLRAQGIDPYRQLTQEEEKQLEEDRRIYDLKRRYGDDWKKYNRYYNEYEWWEDGEMGESEFWSGEFSSGEHSSESLTWEELDSEEGDDDWFFSAEDGGEDLPF